ncbi:glycoside hydrolase family 5 protein [Streptomyces sp. NBC_01515]|uniref:cellulase family glycosylhydrolase n=1 Tax=Streptomyces sp. NBC_01515 TaxID=2903890 RepID=UPI003863E80B
MDRAIADGFYVIIFDTTWTRNAAAFRNEPAQLIFESVNEPKFDNADNARAAEFPNELNTSFCTPDQPLMNNLATTIKPLHDSRPIATMHYYGCFLFSVNVAGAIRLDAQAHGDLDKTFQRMHDTFVAKGVPVVLGHAARRQPFLRGQGDAPGRVRRPAHPRSGRFEISLHIRNLKASWRLNNRPNMSTPVTEAPSQCSQTSRMATSTGN